MSAPTSADAAAENSGNGIPKPAIPAVVLGWVGRRLPAWARRFACQL